MEDQDRELPAALTARLAASGALRAPRWIRAFETVPWHLFVPRVSVDHAHTGSWELVDGTDPVHRHRRPPPVAFSAAPSLMCNGSSGHRVHWSREPGQVGATLGDRTGHYEGVRKVVILGRGGAGKSALARELSSLTGIPATELDSIFWQQGQSPTPAEEWVVQQRELVARETWILDGDLGPYDSGLGARLAAADTIIVLNFGLVRCVWRTLRRGREQAEYWHWIWSYRRRYLAKLRIAIAGQVPRAEVHVLRNPAAVRRFLASIQAR
jgi:hypothetical protein